MNNEHAFIHSDSITNKNILFYKKYGYLIASDLLSKTEIDELKKETASIFRGERGKIEGMLPRTGRRT